MSWILSCFGFVYIAYGDGLLVIDGAATFRGRDNMWEGKRNHQLSLELEFNNEKHKKTNHYIEKDHALGHGLAID